MISPRASRHLSALALISLAVIAALASPAAADGTRAQFQLGERGTPHVGLPFELDLTIEGFDEQPEPTAPKLDIPNATATFLDARPNMSRFQLNDNGRITNSVQVQWTLRWQVEVHREGRLHIPSVTVSQGSKRATAPSGEVNVETIPTTDMMKLSLGLPDRPVFVGETVPVTLTWLFRSDPSGQRWSFPLLDSDAFTASAPPAAGNDRLLPITAGGKELRLPFKLDKTDDGYTRLQATLFLAPRKVGKLDVPPSSVVAGLAVGRPDFFGNAASKLFRATDQARTIEVKPLPETDKPANFAGAVGDQFSIDVTTSRSVVKLGEPVELQIRIKSNQRLDTLALGRIDGANGLAKDKFVVPAEPATGELSDDGKTKTFKVVAQVTGPATEVPAIAFAYFDPTRTAYQTIHSEPIALSVAGGSVVGAGDVVAAAPRPTPGKGSGAAAAPGGMELDGALVDAQLALSSPGQADSRPLDGAPLWILIALLYALPIALFAGRRWQLRTEGQREEAAEVKTARKKVEALLDRAATEPARDVAGPLAAALRELARMLSVDAPREALLAKLETESFSQGASTVPLSADLRSDAAGLLRRWTTEARRAKPRRPASHGAAIALIGAGLALSATRTFAADKLDDARASYQEAMQDTNPTARRAAFSRAAGGFGDAVRATPDRPELITDWGNAALGAGDVATATLAYRRALAIDSSNARARHNLAWLRSRQPDVFRPPTGGATDTLLFFQSWPRGKKLVVGSAAFAIALLLLVPWSGRRRRGFTGLALLPFAVWLAMLASVVLEDRHPDDAVVMDAVVMRAADSAGAPAALAQPLSRGVEVTVIDRRDAWTQIRLAGGTTGWVPAGAVEKITPR